MPDPSPTIAQTEPYPVEVEADEMYWWCACGNSKTQPFCDGSHAGTLFRPMVYRPTESGEVWFCGCKHSANKPLCDGSHNKL